MKKIFKNKWIICVILLLLIVIIAFFCIKSLSKNSNKSNIQIDDEIEGTYTGYQLTLTASYGGYGYAGQNLGSGTNIKVYNITENDIFYEPFMGGIWELNLKESNSLSTILKINSIENENIQLEFENKKYIARYDEEIKISPNAQTVDGVNYSYTIKISKAK